MLTSAKQKIFVGLIVFLILGFLGYSLFSKGSSTELDSTTSSETGVPGQDILTLVEKLKNISISQTIFSSPLFNNLIDFSNPISPEPVGRANPFSPIGSDASSINLTGPRLASSTRSL